MRRTDEEFKAEVLRRSDAFRRDRKKRMRGIGLACVPLVLCGAICIAALPGVLNSKRSATEICYGASPQAIEGAVEEKCCDCAKGVTVEIKITTAPDGAAWSITDPADLLAVLEGIQAFYDDAETVPGGPDVGQAEGMSYTLIVTEGDERREYTLFNGALLTEQGWLVNEGCYHTLEALLRNTE